MIERSINDENLKKYRSLYEDPNLRRAYEIRDKLLIFNSLKHFLGDVKEKKFLEIGFGTGDILLSLAKRKADCYGIETSESAIKSLRNVSHHSLHLRKRTDDQLPFISGFFDVVICSHVLEHIKNDKKELKEINRVLKADGLVVLGVPGRGVGHNSLHYREYTIGSIRTRVRGWQIIHMKKYGSKLFQKMLALVRERAMILSKDSKNMNSLRKGRNDLRRVSLLSRIYYNVGVPFLLFILYLDNLLPLSKKDPVEIWAILKKVK